MNCIKEANFRYKTKIDYFSFCMEFESTPGILLADEVFKQYLKKKKFKKVMQKRVLPICGKREVHFLLYNFESAHTVH